MTESLRLTRAEERSITDMVVSGLARAPGEWTVELHDRAHYGGYDITHVPSGFVLTDDIYRHETYVYLSKPDPSWPPFGFWNRCRIRHAYRKVQRVRQSSRASRVMAILAQQKGQPG